MLICCTLKLLKELKTPITTNPDPASESWHANLLRIDRRKCVLLTHDKTLYSIFLPALRKPDFAYFTDLFQQHLFKTLRLDGFPQPQIEFWLEQMRQIEYAKTNNRRVLGSMNDYAFQLKTFVALDGGFANADLHRLYQRINDTPMSAINYDNGLSAMQKYLASFSK